MGATKESPAFQVLEWAVGKLDEASKVDWVEKFTTLTASQPAYLRNGVLGALAPSITAPTPAAAPAGEGVSRADLDAALSRATRAEARADSLAQRVAQLERELASVDSHDDVELPAESDEDHKHWWSRH
jgi:hypothetical protein